MKSVQTIVSLNYCSKCKRLLADATRERESVGISSASGDVQLPEDVELMVLEVENLIQQMASDEIENLETPTQIRSLYHIVGSPPPVFIQQ